jgi:hypothetical protein
MARRAWLISRDFDGGETVMVVGSQSSARRSAVHLIRRRRDFTVRALPGDVWRFAIRGEWPEADDPAIPDGTQQTT